MDGQTVTITDTAAAAAMAAAVAAVLAVVVVRLLLPPPPPRHSPAEVAATPSVSCVFDEKNEDEDKARLSEEGC